jgi:DNA-directed RNA polymerase specialized sigma24 family protein
MMVDDPKSRQMLQRIAAGLTGDDSLREDLTQEALVHLWLLEEKQPGQKPSWYYQSCRYHMRNRITMGRSVDALKRKGGRVNEGGDEDQLDHLLGGGESDGEVVNLASAREILALISSRLRGTETEILACLFEGMGAREIARRLKVSHPAILKHRRKIAALALRLGINPMPANNGKRSKRARRVTIKAR